MQILIYYRTSNDLYFAKWNLQSSTERQDSTETEYHRESGEESGLDNGSF